MCRDCPDPPASDVHYSGSYENAKSNVRVREESYMLKELKYKRDEHIREIVTLQVAIDAVSSVV